MRRFLRSILLRPVIWASDRFSSRPKRPLVFAALDKLYKRILDHSGEKGLVLPFEKSSGKFIIFSDQHKGARDGSDDFILSEPNYLAALDHYYRKGFVLISMGDSEELWENSLTRIKKANAATFEAEAKFIPFEKFIKIYGNHDLFWDNDPFAGLQLKDIYKEKVKIYEGAVLSVQTDSGLLHILCTHGHQGDQQSDGNWFSKFFVARIWAPLQAYLLINPDTPAYDKTKKSLHNDIMYEWSSQQKNMLLITGHTHQPVFCSLTQLERLYKAFQLAQSQKDSQKIVELQEMIRKVERKFSSVSIDYMKMRPSYFNSGCCCYTDGDITGIEIDEGCIRLIKWETTDETPQRHVLEEISIENLVKQL